MFDKGNTLCSEGGGKIWMKKNFQTSNVLASNGALYGKIIILQAEIKLAQLKIYFITFTRIHFKNKVVRFN